VKAEWQKRFEDMDHARVAMEAGTHSIWISEQLKEYGHEVIVANVTELHAISRNDSKSDRTDAEKLARYARLDPRILRPITHRTVEQQQALTMIRARDVLVRLRTAVVNAARGLAKPWLSPACCIDPQLPGALAAALEPLFAQIAHMNEQIKLYDRAILKMATVTYPETQALTQVHGVGPLTAVTYVLTLGSKERFERSRDVGCYLGLRPKRSQSGDRDPQLGITKAGDEYLRRLLTECANFIRGRFGKDSSLRRWGLHLAERGGRNARKKAIVAVARKLAVLLHRLWVTKQPYVLLYQAQAA
jgi:transposase